jgi:hypothetical protein
MSALLLTDRPRAEAASVEDLLVRISRGEVRVPTFQRPFAWKRDDVKKLLDSVWRGYPVGALLFWEKHADAGHLRVGPLEIDAPETSRASWVIDGQQRLTALAGSLLYPRRLDRGALELGALDEFAWFFDLEAKEFVSPRAQPPPAHWVPVNALGNSVETLKWAKDKPEDVAGVAFEVSKALREYRLPLYVVSTASESVLREIFDRLNSSGKALTAAQVFNALHGGAGEEPKSLAALAEKLLDLRFGRLDEDLLLTTLMAIRGLDVTRAKLEQAHDPRLEGALPESEAALRRAIVFLKTSARIQHIDVLPYRLALQVLARFFALHPEPRSRTLELLSRWVWRGALSGDHGDSSRAFAREQFRAIFQDEEASVQKLLSGTTKAPQPPPALDEFRWRQKAQSRIQMLSLIALGPRHLSTGEVLAPDALLESLGDASPPEIVDRRSSAAAANRDRAASIANRLIHPPESKPQLQAWIRAQADPEVLASHGIDAEARAALLAGDDGRFLSLRSATLARHLEGFLKARAAWNHSDRPSLQYELALVEDGVETT